MIIDVLLDRKLKELPSDALGKDAERSFEHLIQNAWKICSGVCRMQKACVKPDRFFDKLAPTLTLVAAIARLHDLPTFRRQPEREFVLSDYHARSITSFFVGTPLFFLETADFFHSATPSDCFSLLLERPRKSPKLSAPRADVTAAGRARPRGFVLLRRLRLCFLPEAACRLASSAFAVSATPPHIGAVSGFQASGGYALGCARKAVQTADTGATAWNALPVTATSPASAPIPTFSAADLW